MKSLAEIENFWAQICRNPEYPAVGRFKTYRHLVKSGFLDVLKNLNPVANELLSDGEWEVLYWDFVQKAPPQSSILRQLPQEFAEYLKTRAHPLVERYPYLGELIEYEYLEVAVRYGLNPPEKMKPAWLYLNPAHALRAYHWPVHFIDKNNSEPQNLPQGKYYLFLWRHSKNYEVKFMEVNPLVASLLEALVEKPFLRPALIQRVAKEHQILLSENFIKEAQILIESLIEKNILFTI